MSVPLLVSHGPNSTLISTHALTRHIPNGGVMMTVRRQADIAGWSMFWRSHSTINTTSYPQGDGQAVAKEEIFDRHAARAINLPTYLELNHQEQTKGSKCLRIKIEVAWWLTQNCRWMSANKVKECQLLNDPTPQLPRSPVGTTHQAEVAISLHLVYR